MQVAKVKKAWEGCCKGIAVRKVLMDLSFAKAANLDSRTKLILMGATIAVTQMLLARRIFIVDLLETSRMRSPVDMTPRPALKNPAAQTVADETPILKPEVATMAETADEPSPEEPTIETAEMTPFLAPEIATTDSGEKKV